MTHSLLFPSSSDVPDWLALMHHLINEGRLTKDDMMQLVKIAMGIFSNITIVIVL
jgi:hypothetical protein